MALPFLNINNTSMKTLFPFLLILALAVGCQSSTYYSAQNVNQKRFGGWQKENADYLVKANDLTLTLKTLYEMGKDQTSFKDTYLVSADAEKELEMLLIEMKFQAATRRVRLSSSLSPGNDNFIHDLKKISKENFEFMWGNAIEQKTLELKQLSGSYRELGHDESLQEFAGSVIQKIEPFQDKIGHGQAKE